MTTTISAEEYRALLAAEGQRAHKYGATPVRDEEGYFASTGERERWGELQTLARLGAIRDLRRQVRYPLRIADELVTTYVADFVYDEEGSTVVEDYKGFRTGEYRLKARLMRLLLGIVIRETGR
jgi:hypothetical protein